MHLRTAAGLAMAALAATFMLRAGNTLWPGALRSPGAAAVAAALLAVAALLLAAFFLTVRRLAADRRRATLAAAAALAAGGAGLAALGDLWGLGGILGLAPAVKGVVAQTATAWAGLLTALSFVGFFAALHRSSGDRLPGTGLALAGAVVLALPALATLWLTLAPAEPAPGPPSWLVTILPLILLLTAAALAAVLRPLARMRDGML